MSRVVIHLLLALAFLAGAFNCFSALPADAADFVVNPYVQLGPRSPSANSLPSVTVQWGAIDSDRDFQVEWRNKGDTQWNTCPRPTFRRVAPRNLTPFRLYSTEISGINSGAAIQFHVLVNRRGVFDGSCIAPKTGGDKQTFAVFGDIGVGSLPQGAIARQVQKAHPDYAVLTGDLVYGSGTISEYLRNWFPIMNASDLGVISGAALMSSTLVVAAAGNHDLIMSNNLGATPDGLGYFIFWSQPLNGPGQSGKPNTTPIQGSQSELTAFRNAAGDNFPRMAQFSFDYGNAHWTMVDANPYMDWTNAELRSWLEKDLAAAKDKQWRFVVLHQAPFTSNWTHMEEQRMRLICDILEKGKVDIVFSGHSHNYERSYPLRFAIDKAVGTKALPTIPGSLQLDKSFDGKSDSTPDGVIYVVTGAGGAPLTIGRHLNVPYKVQPYTQKLIAQPHSFTLCEISGGKLKLRQISAFGLELDSITIDKAAEAQTSRSAAH